MVAPNAPNRSGQDGWNRRSNFYELPDNLAEQITLENCGHVPQVERPEETNRLLMDFFARAQAAEPTRPAVVSAPVRTPGDAGGDVAAA